MPRSFQIVEYKIAEAEFFLSKFISCTKGKIRFSEANFYFSAFLTSARSTTFALQAVIAEIQELAVWYQQQQEILKQNEEARFFVEARNLSEKVGYYPIKGGSSYKDEKGILNILLYFDIYNSENLKFVPKEDVATVSVRFFKILISLIGDAYKKFGYLIDPEKYYTIENMNRLNKSVEDFEEEIGFPRGWTLVDGFSDEDRMIAIRNNERTESIDWVFLKYFKTNRFGEK